MMSERKKSSTGCLLAAEMMKAAVMAEANRHLTRSRNDVSTQHAKGRLNTGKVSDGLGYNNNGLFHFQYAETRQIGKTAVAHDLAKIA